MCARMSATDIGGTGRSSGRRAKAKDDPEDFDANQESLGNTSSRRMMSSTSRRNLGDFCREGRRGVSLAFGAFKRHNLECPCLDEYIANHEEHLESAIPISDDTEDELFDSYAQDHKKIIMGVSRRLSNETWLRPCFFV